MITELAFAKINLTLDVLSLRPDGYHEVDMVMQSVGLCDRLHIALKDAPGIDLVVDDHNLPGGEGNLAHRAAVCLLRALDCPKQGVSIRLNKHIPVCAGTAGGSSDAAAVLRGLHRLLGSPLSSNALQKLGEEIGSDVPYCVLGGTARAQGRGERLTALPALPPCFLVLCKPDFGVSTPWLFRKIDETPVLQRPDTAGMLSALQEGDLRGIARLLGNVFTAVLPDHQRVEVEAIKARLCALGALGACMSGTGPTVFGLFEKALTAQLAAKALQGQYKQVFFTKPV